MKLCLAAATFAVIATWSCSTRGAPAKNATSTLNHCETVKSVVWSTEEAFSTREQDMILEALDVWSTGTGGRLAWIKGDGGLHFYRMVDKKAIAEVDRQIGGHAVGLYRPELNSIGMVIERIQSSDMFRTVAIHEVGHALGLTHKNHRMFTYMRPDVNAVPDDLWFKPHLPDADRESYWNLDSCSDSTKVTVTFQGDAI